MSERIDYASVEVPDDGNPSEWTYAERRAGILREVREAGHPRLVNQAELGRRYDVSRQQIHKDLDAVAESVGSSLGTRHVLATDATFQKCIAELIAAGEWRDAARTAKDHSDWVTERVELRQLREEVEAVVEAQQRARHR